MWNTAKTLGTNAFSFFSGSKMGEGFQSETGIKSDLSGVPPQDVSKYQNEQSSNAYYPPDGAFMSKPVYEVGQVASSVMPDKLLGKSIEHLSEPSNPQSVGNREKLALAGNVVGTGISLLPHPAAKVIGPMISMGSGFIFGAEKEAQQQAKETPRAEPRPNIMTDPEQIAPVYQKTLPEKYKSVGMGPQAQVVKHLQPTATNAQISTQIWSRLGDKSPSPFEALSEERQ